MACGTTAISFGRSGDGSTKLDAAASASAVSVGSVVAQIQLSLAASKCKLLQVHLISTSIRTAVRAAVRAAAYAQQSGQQQSGQQQSGQQSEQQHREQQSGQQQHVVSSSGQSGHSTAHEHCSEAPCMERPQSIVMQHRDWYDSSNKQFSHQFLCVLSLYGAHGLVKHGDPRRVPQQSCHGQQLHLAARYHTRPIARL